MVFIDCDWKAAFDSDVTARNPIQPDTSWKIDTFEKAIRERKFDDVLREKVSAK